MRSANSCQEQNEMMIPENGQAIFQKPQNQHHKQFWATTIHKTVPIGFEFHQIQVPDFQPVSPSVSRQQLPTPKSQPVYLRSKVQEEELEEYLSFVENYFQQKIPDYFAQGVVSRDRNRTKAMQFLHQMDYNYTKAKFYILFPYYLTYNRYKCYQPLQLSNQEMSRRIEDHLQGLKSTKEKQLQRWIGTVQNSIQSRIHLSKLNTLIQVAKQNKYQIPEAIRDNVQKSIRTGREIKKALHSTKLPLDKLISKRQSLQEYKIITNQMIQFEQTVGRCEEWLKKQNKFQDTFFVYAPQPQLKLIPEKIQFRILQLLVNQFNNLPLIYQNFQKTTGALYNSTLALLERLPPLNKAAKTRTAQTNVGGTKINIQIARQYLREIQKCPVQHEQFTNFQSTIRQNLEWLQRIGMWLEDEKSEKSLKILNQYSKIINDIPLINKIQQKLQSRLQYYEIMQRVKKDISNPAKYQQIKDSIKKLKEKGYETCQYAKLQTRIIIYMGWYESQQILNEDRLPHSNLDLVIGESAIKARMIPEEAFKNQLLSARNELNIPQDVWIDSENKVKAVQELKFKISLLNEQNQPEFSHMLQILRACIKNGLLFPQFQYLYQKVKELFNLLGQMTFLLMSNGQQLPQGQTFFFSIKDVEVIITGLLQNLQSAQLKDFQTKQAGDQILLRAQAKGFPRNLPQYLLFQLFMSKAQKWSIKARNLINAFKSEQGEVNIRQLIQQSKNYLHSKSIEEELSRIDVILKWREKISRKLCQNKQTPFDQNDHAFMKELQVDLQQAQLCQDGGEKTKFRALEYLWANGKKIANILEKISNAEIECTFKLSQMNKFCKEVDREIEKYKLEDKMINSLKQQLQQQLLLSDEWKEKYLSIKRFEKKKLKKDDEDLKQIDIQIDYEQNQNKMNISQGQNGEGAFLVPYVPQLLSVPSSEKKKYYIRNGQFCWFYKLPLLIFEFYNGYNLKFAIDDLVRLRGILADVQRFILHYNTIMEKPDKTDSQLTSLEAESSKIPFFFRESFVLSKKNAYINTWKEIADSVLKSVPVLSMQLKARKPEELLQLLEMKKLQQQQGREQRRQELGNKRKRKQNPYYSNEDMTLITEETFGLKTKKKRKGTNPDQQYRNTAVASSAKKLARTQKEDVERAQALLAGEVPAELIHIDDPKQYCICRYGVPNENSIMIQCQHKCQEWYHIECLGIKKHQTKSDAKLRCVGCKALYKQESLSYFFWDSHTKITQYALVQLVLQGKQLKVETQQMKKLQILYTKMLKWKDSVKDMLIKVCQTNGQDLPALEPPLYELFLQSLWLPSAHPESAILRKLVLMARNEI